MKVLHPRCAGLDAHKSLPSRSGGDGGDGVRIVSDGEVSRAVRTFETTTAGLIELVPSCIN